jgi:hypothetical protein
MISNLGQLGWKQVVDAQGHDVIDECLATAAKKTPSGLHFTTSKILAKQCHAIDWGVINMRGNCIYVPMVTAYVPEYIERTLISVHTTS